MLDRLGLGPHQMQNARRLYGPSPQKSKAIERLRSESKKMLDLYSQYDLDAIAARRLIDSIHKSQVEISELELTKHKQIRSLLTERQFQRLQEEIAKKMRAQKRRAPR